MAEAGIIKAIEAGAVHQIQSGQVIVDLCSVAKELIENSLDSGATSIEVRFKNQGLDSIEVQDNGSGIAPRNYEAVALKHHTSKLSSYADLDTLHTFGFRGEALSSLCALSHFSVTTCLQSDVPRGTKLEFETSGKLKGTSVVAAQKGTTVSVETLFYNLPVRRRELERHIKREWGKVISLLNQYACIQTGVKITVSQQPSKGKRTIMFATKGNKTTRENIINVFGAKTMSALITLDLELKLEPTTKSTIGAATGARKHGDKTTTIYVRGHVSRPARGDGRQTPDRQMFYVNGRPCTLPQFAKVFNEVYRAYNVTQSPFIFADVQLDTHLYDVNVSPDKRTILLHDQGRMLDNMREALIELFEKQDITIPVSQLSLQKLSTPSKMPAVLRQSSDMPGSLGQEQAGVRGAVAVSTTTPEPVPSNEPSEYASDHEESGASSGPNFAGNPSAEVGSEITEPTTQWAQRVSNDHPGSIRLSTAHKKPLEHKKSESIPDGVAALLSRMRGDYNYEDKPTLDQPEPVDRSRNGNFGGSRLQQPLYEKDGANVEEDTVETGRKETPIPAVAPPRSQGIRVDSAPFAFTTLKRPSAEVATITVSGQTVTSLIGSSAKRQRKNDAPQNSSEVGKSPALGKGKAPLPSFNGRLTQMFAAASARQSASETSGMTMSGLPRAVEESQDDDLSIHTTDDGKGMEDESDMDASGESDPEVFPDPQRKSVSLEPPGDDVEPTETSSTCHQDVDGDAESPGIFVNQEDELRDDGTVDEMESMGQKEDTMVEQGVPEAKAASEEPSEDAEKRSRVFLKGRVSGRKDSTFNLVQNLKLDGNTILRRESSWYELQDRIEDGTRTGEEDEEEKDVAGSTGGDEDVAVETNNAEAKLSLTIRKSDFERMKVVGQFNLGFILAVREKEDQNCNTRGGGGGGGGGNMMYQDGQHNTRDDELFIIDQHASDEKYNFERLQATTVVQSQRLVRPKLLELTALEEEIVLANQEALEANGFVVEVDESGESEVGQRCRLISLPLSRETTFSLADLEELISLLADNPTTSATTVPRPSRVRSMFAMRACRSSIMVGRALSRPQMEKVVRHMGGMEKPWNCPHGRPTMRHLCSLGAAWTGRLWAEGDGFGGGGGGDDEPDWSVYA